MSIEKIQQRLRNGATPHRAVAAGATPLDLAPLLEAGIIEPQGEWFKVIRWAGLPAEAKDQIVEMQSAPEVLVKFYAPVE